MNEMHSMFLARSLDQSHQVYILSKFLEIINMKIFMNIAQGIKEKKTNTHILHE